MWAWMIDCLYVYVLDRLVTHWQLGEAPALCNYVNIYMYVMCYYMFIIEVIVVGGFRVHYIRWSYNDTEKLITWMTNNNLIIFISNYFWSFEIQHRTDWILEFFFLLLFILIPISITSFFMKSHFWPSIGQLSGDLDCSSHNCVKSHMTTL